MTLPDNGNSLPPVQVEAFEGPLDLLLDEVRRQNVAIEKISMAPIVARFLEYIRTATERNLNLDIDWLHLAATLIHWKSRSLLPAEAIGETAADLVRDSLVQQLLAHRKQVAEELDRRRAVEETRFSRAAADGPFVPAGPATDEPDEPGFVSVWDLIQQARELGRWVEQQREDRRRWRESFGVDQDDVTVSEMMDYLRDQLSAADGRLDGVALLESQATASRRSCLFLGMLEMARDQRVDLQQNEIFGQILLTDAVDRSGAIRWSKRDRLLT